MIWSGKYATEVFLQNNFLQNLKNLTLSQMSCCQGKIILTVEKCDYTAPTICCIVRLSNIFLRHLFFFPETWRKLWALALQAGKVLSMSYVYTSLCSSAVNTFQMMWHDVQLQCFFPPLISNIFLHSRAVARRNDSFHSLKSDSWNHSLRCYM